MNPAVQTLFLKVISFFSSIFLLIQGVIRVPTFTVTFYDCDHITVLAVENNIPEGGYAVPPVASIWQGKKFLGWSGNYVNVSRDENVYAVYDDAQNVFIASSKIGKGGLISVLISIDGRVNTCGFDFSIKYDEDLTLVSYDDDLDLDVIVNIDKSRHKGFLNFSAATNKTNRYDLIELVFQAKEASKDVVSVSMQMNNVMHLNNNNVVDSDYSIINAVIFQNDS